MKNEFDKRLTNRGWRVMRQMLDREMPEQRRRRFAWWLIALLLLPLAGAGGWWLLQAPANPAPQVPPPPNISKPVVEAESTGLSSQKDKIASANDPKAELHNRAANAPDVAVFPEANARLSGGSESPADLKAQDFSQPSKFLQKEDGLELSGHALQHGEVAIAEAYLSTEAKSTDELSSVGALQSLEMLPVSPQFVENENKNKISLAPIAVTQPATTKKFVAPKRWTFGLAAGLISENLSALNGFSAGAVVDWQFHQKWGLRAGLQYAQIRPLQTTRPVVSVSGDDYVEATNDFGVTAVGHPSSPNLDTQPLVLVPVEQFRQIEMPLSAWWQPVRPLRVFAGIASVYRLSTQASDQILVDNQLYKPNVESAKSGLNTLTSNTLPHWQINWQIGASVRLGKHLEIGAFYKSRFPNFKNEDALRQFDPSLPPSNIIWEPRDTEARSSLTLNGIWFF